VHVYNRGFAKTNAVTGITHYTSITGLTPNDGSATPNSIGTVNGGAVL